MDPGCKIAAASADSARSQKPDNAEALRLQKEVIPLFAWTNYSCWFLSRLYAAATYYRWSAANLAAKATTNNRRAQFNSCAGTCISLSGMLIDMSQLVINQPS